MYSSTGSWSGSPARDPSQWKRCDSAGGNCSAIAGEVFSGYTLAAADVGSTLRVTVTATASSS